MVIGSPTKPPGILIIEANANRLRREGHSRMTDSLCASLRPSERSGRLRVLRYGTNSLSDIEFGEALAKHFVRRRRCVDDVAVTERIKQVVDTRPTYGYLRTARIVSRNLLAEGGAPVNAKRVYRIMKAQGWLLARHTGKSTRTHDGVIITLRSNLRWCSDAFEIRCWSGERVQVAFSLDCCDREVMSYVATTAAITGEMIRDLMAESVEGRFGAEATRTPHAVEWLSDNGPPYTAHETRDFGENLGLLVCTTPAYSPESNGMAESFVKTFKRDYVYVNELRDAESVMRQLAEWFEDYNEVHPHKGLRMQSPREYRRATANA